MVVVFLSGCGNNSVPAQKQMPAVTSKQADINSNPTASTDEISAPAADTKSADLPVDVSTEPAATPDAEIKNIDKDLKAIDSSNAQDSISNKDLGL